MSLESGLVAELLADAGVAAIVGTKVHPELIPQNGTLPALVYTRMATLREQQLAGPQSMALARVRIDCWHTSAAGVWALADAVRSALDVGEKALLGSFTVQQIYLDEQFQQGDFEGDRRDYRVIQEYVIRYVEV